MKVKKHDGLFHQGRSGNPDGRPPKQYPQETLELIEKLASISCTMEEISAVTGIPKAALEKKFLKNLIEPGRNKGRASLRRKQWALAEKGNATMMIWLGKQWLGQKEKIERTDDPNQPKAPTKVEVIWQTMASTPETNIEYDTPPPDRPATELPDKSNM